VVDVVSALTTVRRVEVTQPSETRIGVTLTSVALNDPTPDMAVLRDRIAALNGVLQTLQEAEQIRYQVEVPTDSSADAAPFLSEALGTKG